MNIWENLPKNPLEPQRISEAIDAAVEAHSADPEAHLAEGASVEMHRQNEIIDHPAESVVNDKLFSSARAYTAIVDPTHESDYDTIEGAIEFVDSVGGGNILIMPGTHYLNETVELKANVNLYGVDRNTCTIVTNATSGGVFRLEDIALYTDESQTIERLTFQSDDGFCFDYGASGDISMIELIFNACTFVGNNRYLSINCFNMNFNDCIFFIGTQACIVYEGGLYLNNCLFAPTASPSTAVCFGTTGAGELDIFFSAFDTSFRGALGGTVSAAIPTFAEVYAIEACNIGGVPATAITLTFGRFHNNLISFNSTGYLSLDTSNSFVSGNRFIGGTGNRVRLAAGSSRCMVNNNIVGTAITNSGSNNMVTDNILT